MEQLRLAYITRLPATARKLQEVARQVPPDPEKVRLLCHRLRGSAGAYGLPQLSELAARAEDAPDATLVDSVERIAAHIEDLVARLEVGPGKGRLRR